MKLTVQIEHNLFSELFVQHCAHQRFGTLVGGAWVCDGGSQSLHRIVTEILTINWSIHRASQTSNIQLTLLKWLCWAC
jgi:hypothetical protein